LRLERPKHAEQGDYATNAALLLAPALREGPPKIAELLARELHRELGELLERTEVAGPGFLNLFLADAWYRHALADIVAASDRFGTEQTQTPERILIEFVSANPTGPLVAASGRHAAYGDALARILEHFGHTVSRAARGIRQGAGAGRGGTARGIRGRLRRGAGAGNPGSR
jgi:arginyl-tRNA synthetase